MTDNPLMQEQEAKKMINNYKKTISIFPNLIYFKFPFNLIYEKHIKKCFFLRFFLIKKYEIWVILKVIFFYFLDKITKEIDTLNPKYKRLKSRS